MHIGGMKNDDEPTFTTLGLQAFGLLKKLSVERQIDRERQRSGERNEEHESNDNQQRDPRAFVDEFKSCRAHQLTPI
jgi:hypothetical protein